jgi:hypothetical protein
MAEIMELSGINQQLDNIPLQIASGLQQPSVLPAEFNNNLASALNTGFKPDTLKTTIRDYLEEHLSIADTNAVLNWLHSPLGMKVSALEAQSFSPEAQAEMQQMFPKLLANARRFALIRDLDKATNTSASTIVLILSVQEALMRGMMAGAPASQQLSDEEIKNQINAMAPQIQSQYELLVIASMAYTYRTLEDADISAYIAFARSPAGIHFNQTMMEAITVAMQNGGEITGREMRRMMPAKPANATKEGV